MSETPKYLHEYLEQTRKFLNSLTDEGLKNLRGFLPDELYELVFKLVPRFCVDIVIVDDKNSSLVLAKRDRGANMGMWYIPGGWIKYGERVEEAVIKMAKEETGLDVEIDKNKLRNGIIKIYDDINIDKIGWKRGVGFSEFNPNAFTNSVPITFLTRPTGGNLIKDGKKEARFFEMNESKLPEVLPYHHRQVIEDAQRLLQQKSQ